jgi:hypothetical protein
MSVSNGENAPIRQNSRVEGLTQTGQIFSPAVKGPASRSLVSLSDVQNFCCCGAQQLPIFTQIPAAWPSGLPPRSGLHSRVVNYCDLATSPFSLVAGVPPFRWQLSHLAGPIGKSGVA